MPLRGLADALTLLPLARANPWRVGSVLQAVVLDASQPGRAELQIGGQTVSARTVFQLSEGETLSLRVTHKGELVVAERVQGAGAQPAPARETALVQQAMRQALPRQTGFAPLLATLAQVAGAGERSALPAALVQEVRQLLAQLVSEDELVQPQRLREAIRDSGLFFEARTAGADPGAGGAPRDLKAMLTRLASLLQQLAPPGDARARQAGAFTNAQGTESGPLPAMPRGAAAPATPVAQIAPRPGMDPSPPLQGAQPQAQPRAEPPALPPLREAPAEILRQVEGALARIELSQLASLPSDDGGGRAWLFDLPVRAQDGQVDVLQMRIEREADRQRDDDHAVGADWRVSLAFDLGDLGPVEARVALRGNDRVSTLFFADAEDTVRQVRAALPSLEQALERRGLQVAALGCREGPAQPSLLTTVNLVEERA